MEQKVHHGGLILERVRPDAEEVIAKHETIRDAANDPGRARVLYLADEDLDFRLNRGGVLQVWNHVQQRENIRVLA